MWAGGIKHFWRQPISLSGTNRGLVSHSVPRLKPPGTRSLPESLQTCGQSLLPVVSVHHFSPRRPASVPHWTWIKTRCQKANEESVAGMPPPPTPLTCTLIYLSGVGKLTCWHQFVSCFFPLMQLELKQNRNRFDKVWDGVQKKSWLSKRLFNKSNALSWICTC